MANLPDFNLGIFSSLVALFFLFGLFVTSKKIWGVFDPLLLVLFNVSFNVAIVAFYGIVNSDDLSFFFYVLFGWLFFLFGLRAKCNIRFIFSGQNAITEVPWLNRNATAYLLVISIAMQWIWTGFMFWSLGLGMLTGDVNPDIAKVTITQSGLGIFRSLGIAGGMIFIPLIFHAYITHRMRLLASLGVLLFIAQVFIFPVSKAGFFFIIFDIGICLYYYREHVRLEVMSTKKIVFVAAIGLIPAFLTLSLVSSVYKITLLGLLVERFVAGAKGTYEYFVLSGYHYFDNLTFVERLIWYFDTLLSMLRLKPWEEMTYMAFMEGNISGTFQPGFGANPYLFMEGHFLFGWFGVVYCYLVGWFISFSRTRKVDIVIFYCGVKLAMYPVTDCGIAQATIVNLAVLLVPFWLLLYLIAKSQGRNISDYYPLSYFRKR